MSKFKSDAVVLAFALLAGVVGTAARPSSSSPFFEDESHDGVPVPSDVEWHDVLDLGILHGRAFNDTPTPYNRLPSRANGVVRKPVWKLSLDSAGLYLQFISDAPTLCVNFTLGVEPIFMWHFPASGASGMDVYSFDDDSGLWRWVATPNPTQFPVTTYCFPTPASASEPRRYRLNLPTYNYPTSFDLGFPSGSTIRPDPDVPKAAPIVWYGTSILQGGVASRPGQIFTHIIARNLSREIYNFGFSGNGEMEESVYQYLSEIPAAMFIIDCNWNMNATTISERAGGVVTYLRARHPTTPIVLVEGTDYGFRWYDAAGAAAQDAKRLALRHAFDQAISNGVKDLHYVNGSDLYREYLDFIDPTVGGVHPADLGMRKIAAFYTSFLPPLLKDTASGPIPVTPDSEQAPESALDVLRAGSDASHPNSDVANKRDPEPSMKLGRIDPSDAEALADSVFTAYRDLNVLGRGFADTAADHFFSRLPASAEPVVRSAVWNLSLFSTGITIRFVSNSPTLYINHTLWQDPEPLWHMPPSGTSGVDLYVFDPPTKVWRHAGCQVDILQESGVQTLATGLPDDGYRTYLLYLPLRNSVLEGSVGTPSGAYLGTDHDTAPTFEKRIVWYGTSIQQGGVASRGGHAYDAIISRSLGVEIFNLGFAGNGKEEVNVAEWFVNIDHVDALIIDCLWNIDFEEEKNRTLGLYNYVRTHWPDIPIVLAAGTPAPFSWFNEATKTMWDEKNDFMAAFVELHKHSDANLYFMPSDALYARAGTIEISPYVNPTVGGTHPSDLGQFAVADAYINFLPKIL